MTYPTDRPAVWFVTGASRGLGLALVKHLLERGDRVAATTRSSERLLAALTDLQTDNLLLPQMRVAGGGHIINVSSIVGLLAFPGWGLYSASKFAIEGLSESLAAEVAGFGVGVTIVEPGYFDTAFLTKDSLVLTEDRSNAYPAISEMIATHQAMPGSQPGDPDRAAAAFVTIAQRESGPLHQQFGSDSSGLAEGKAESLRADIVAGRELAHSTDFER